jgi:predicted extracellular nuclease
MKRKLILFLINFWFLNSSAIFSQNSRNDTLFVASWNLENLFDTVDDPGKIDEEFLPGSEKDWTIEKLNKKLSNLASVINAMNNNKGPDLLGVCEVEHESLLKDMISKFFQNKNYATAYLESPDERGIDNGLIFNANKFKLISVSGDTINLDNGDQTRLILNVNLQLKKSGDTLHVFVNHWPSRRGGQEKSEINRIKAASTLKNEVNNYFKLNKNSKIIIVGDFNDEPGNASILKTLDAIPFFCESSPRSKNSSELFNLAYNSFEKGEGTYKYRDDWNMLDQIIVSTSLINGDIKYSCGSFKIFEPDFLVTHSGKYEGTPFPTYGGSRYLGGYSDHFPITAKFIK